MIIFGIFAILLVIYGYFLYGRNLIAIETGDFSAWPWIIFTLLAGNDFANYLFAEDSNWFEISVGGIIFFGPAIISCFIISNGKKQGGVKNDWSKISILEKVIFYLILLAIIAITVIEIFTHKGVVTWGDEVLFEYGFLCFAILLDIVAIKGLHEEIKESPFDFKKLPWFAFLLAGISASIFDIWIGAEVYSIAIIFIFENNIVSILTLYFITKYQK
jgi:hypothetical protein